MYLPLEDLAASGCTVEDLAVGRMIDPVRASDRVRVPRARAISTAGPTDARPAEDRRRLVAAEIMRAVYFETLSRIERNGYDVFSARGPRAASAAGAVIALRQWMWQR